MPRPKSTPSFHVHKRSGRAFTIIDGRQVPLGKGDTPESRAAYHRVLAEWSARGGRPPVPAAAPAPPAVTITVLVDRFWAHAQTYYRQPDGTPTTELDTQRQVLRLLRRLYGSTPAADFGPLKLKAVREAMIRPETFTHPATGKPADRPAWCRTYANQQTDRIRMLFKWGAENELVPAAVYHALKTVAGLRKGRTEARETERVRPVPEATVLQALPFMPPPVAAMVRLELLSGARGGELCRLRGADLDRTGAVWVYKPAAHKTAHHGHEREIRFGPRAQDVLGPFLKMDPAAYLFSPAESEAGRLAKLHAARKTPPGQGNRPGTNRKRKPARRPGARYTKDSYARAIGRACDRAFPPPADVAADPAKLKAWRKAHKFHPHQLRHTAGTKLRKAFGLEAASLILGHASTDMTEVYADRDREQADRIMGEVG